jgi:hypothetical protein
LRVVCPGHVELESSTEAPMKNARTACVMIGSIGRASGKRQGTQALKPLGT